MAATQEKPSPEKTSSSAAGGAPNPVCVSAKPIARAPAGRENSLGAESIRDRRPNTDDSTVEAIDEESPGTTTPLATEKTDVAAKP
jgi:hypothetical protein